MSVGICGYIDYLSDTISEEIDYSYFIMRQSINYKVGCKLGGNISQDAYSIMENDMLSSGISFEIMDTPLDNFANDICQPTISINDPSEIDINEKICSNIGNLQEFLQSILNFEKVNQIVIYFNYEFLQDNYKEERIDINIFKSTILDNYKKNDLFTPTLVLRISR